jgi:hypothetical protein
MLTRTKVETIAYTYHEKPAEIAGVNRTQGYAGAGVMVDLTDGTTLFFSDKEITRMWNVLWLGVERGY